MFLKEDIAEYYDSTQNHYEKWWSLKQHLSLHYGIWDASTKTHGEALENTNRILLETSGIKASDVVLDAGCGVGGAAFFIHRNTKAKVTGISLSQRQIDLATQMAVSSELQEGVTFLLRDFTKTNFADETFDVVWCCEAMCHAANKADFIRESFRILKKGGRLIVSDYFIPSKSPEDKNEWMEKWRRTWAMGDFVSEDFFRARCAEQGFLKINSTDYTDNIRKTAKRMYYAALLGAASSETYNFFNPKVSRFAKMHYKSGYYQYKALKANLWRYKVILATK